MGKSRKCRAHAHGTPVPFMMCYLPMGAPPVSPGVVARHRKRKTRHRGRKTSASKHYKAEKCTRTPLLQKTYGTAELALASDADGEQEVPQFQGLPQGACPAGSSEVPEEAPGDVLLEAALEAIFGAAKAGSLAVVVPVLSDEIPGELALASDADSERAQRRPGAHRAPLQLARDGAGPAPLRLAHLKCQRRFLEICCWRQLSKLPKHAHWQWLFLCRAMRSMVSWPGHIWRLSSTCPSTVSPMVETRSDIGCLPWQVHTPNFSGSPWTASFWPLLLNVSRTVGTSPASNCWTLRSSGQAGQC